MNRKLTLGEKLNNLRYRRDNKLTLNDVFETTGISVSTLQRLEADKDTHVGYQDINLLARFYDVSADYLFGLTDLEQYRNIEVDTLQLSHEAITVLKDGALNNRLISELIAHADFPKLLSAMEIYVDRKIEPQMSAVNTSYKLTEQMIREKNEVLPNDETIALLQELVVEGDDYLLYRISQRFNTVMTGIYEAHGRDRTSLEHVDVFNDMKEQVKAFTELPKTEEDAKKRAIMHCKQLGLDAKELTDEEWRVLMKTLKKSPILNRRFRRKYGG